MKNLFKKQPKIEIKNDLKISVLFNGKDKQTILELRSEKLTNVIEDSSAMMLKIESNGEEHILNIDTFGGVKGVGTAIEETCRYFHAMSEVKEKVKELIGAPDFDSFSEDEKQTFLKAMSGIASKMSQCIREENEPKDSVKH